MKNSPGLLRKSTVETLCFVIGLYQRLLSPDHGSFKTFFGFSRCRFFPSCSEYARSSFRQYGLFLGTMVSLKRIFRCNPWSEGGYDPVEGYEIRNCKNIRKTSSQFHIFRIS